MGEAFLAEDAAEDEAEAAAEAAERAAAAATREAAAAAKRPKPLDQGGCGVARVACKGAVCKMGDRLQLCPQDGIGRFSVMGLLPSAGGGMYFYERMELAAKEALAKLRKASAEQQKPLASPAAAAAAAEKQPAEPTARAA